MDVPAEVFSKKPRSAQSNPAWSQDELILALDLYLRHRVSLPSKNHPEIQELSLFLGKMGKALGVGLVTNFRNVNGVYMKLGNFRRWDPNYVKDGKKGLAKGNKLEEEVWAEYAYDEGRLAEVVAAIRAAVEHDLSLELPLRELRVANEPEIQEAEEGRVLTRIHRSRERDRKLVASKKKQALAKYGKLECEVCGFNFLTEYGKAGEGLIDVHHLKPVHTLRPGEKTHLNDLALLCANCHRVVHSSKRWLDLEQLRAAWAAKR
ncbi:HNH endonuclease [Pseudomonas sichuanensis]|uniref:HNH endonuclease n=1 Tax=Pseudomonas sichuanensis TaxID=2213015 RepID=UPI000DA646C3|nr:HNH endonuclease [Pseudomonas sichuanensis]